MCSSLRYEGSQHQVLLKDEVALTFLGCVSLLYLALTSVLVCVRALPDWVLLIFILSYV